MTAKMYYDADTDPAALAGQTVAVIGFGSQGHAHALNLQESGVRVIVGCRRRRRARHRRGAGQQCCTPPRRSAARRRHDRHPRHGPGSGSGTRRSPRTCGRHACPLRPRLQHPLRADQPAGRRRRGDGRPEGTRPPRPLRLRERRRRAGSLRRPPGRHGDRPGARPRLRPGDRQHPGRRPRDDLRRGDRDRPVRRAERPLRGHGCPREDGLRDPRRGRLPARAGLLRTCTS